MREKSKKFQEDLITNTYTFEYNIDKINLLLEKGEFSTNSVFEYIK